MLDIPRHLGAGGSDDFISDEVNQNETVTEATEPFQKSVNSTEDDSDDYTAEYFKNRILNEGFADEDALRKALERSIQDSNHLNF